MNRDDRLAETFVLLADTLVDNFDLIDFLQTLSECCVDLIDVSAAGIMLANSDGDLQHAASSNEQMRFVELLELQDQEGPCFDAYRSNTAIRCASTDEAIQRWPHFGPNAKLNGFAAVSAVPMRLRAQVIGSLNLFSTEPRRLGDDDIRVVQAMADVATIGILQERSIHDAQAFSDQLERALESRVMIEQAKGIVAERSHIPVDEAFDRIRRFSRSNNRLLSETARQVIRDVLSDEDRAALEHPADSPPTP
jgi:GAF domain-containing protein